MAVADEFDKYIEDRDYEGALAVLSKAWHSQYDTSFYLSNMGWTLNQLERPTEAITHLAKAISLYPDDPWNYSQIGYSYQLLDRNDDALEFYKRSIETGGDDVWVNSRIANVLAEMERYEESLDYYQNAIMDSPEDVDLRVSLGNAYCSLKQYENAIEEWTIAFQYSRDDSLVEACALSLFKDEQYDISKQLLKLIKDSPRRYYLKAIIAFEEQSYEKSLEYSQSSLDEDIDHTGLRQLMSDAYFQLGDDEKALEQLSIKRDYWIKGIDKQEEDINLLRHIGMTSITLNDYDGAQEYLLQALDIDPVDIVSIYFYCNALVYSRKYEEALPYFVKLRELDPESYTPESMYNEAYSYFYLNDYRKAIEVVDIFKRISADSLEGFMLELVAESYYNIGEYESCVKEALNSLALDSEQASVYKLMATAHEQLHDVESAGNSILAAAERGLMDEEFYEWSLVALKRMKNKSVLKKVKEYWKKG